MKCVVPGINIRLLGKAVHSLAKIGDELYIEQVANGVAFRTVNSSRSAYACVTFAPEFFERYNSTFASDSEDVAKCKIAMKSCTAVFKNLSTLEKTVERCKINLDPGNTKVVFQLHCKHGIVRTFNLAYIECETLQAVFSKNQTSNTIIASTKLLAETVQNFQANLEEVTLTVSSEKTTFRNYTDDEPEPTKVVHTEMTLDPEEFESYEVEVDTDVTFCMKELRAMLGFTEVCNFPVSIYFEKSGKPVVFSVDNNPLFEADFVLATLGSKAHSQVSVTNNIGAIANKKKTANRNTRTGVRTEPAVPETNDVQQEKSVNNIRKEDNNNAQRIASTRLNKGPHLNQRTSSRDVDNEFLNDLELHDTIPIPVAGGSKPSHTVEAERTEQPPVVTIPQTRLVSEDGNDSDATTDGEGAAVSDAVPGTPPSKKFKSMFLGFSQASYRSQEAEVLASDTDDD